MAKIVAIHSFNKGTGKSHIASNLATLLASEGQRVGLLEANIQSPSLNTIFEINEDDKSYVDDYLLGRSDIKQTVRELNLPIIANGNGHLFIVPSSTRPANITRLLHEGFSNDLLPDAILDLDADLMLDTVIVDTAAGLDEQTLSIVALCNALAVVMVIDRRQYNGTSATIEIARQLEVPQISLFINDIPSLYQTEQVKDEAQQKYHCPTAILEHSEQMASMAGHGIFVLQFPENPLTTAFKEAKAILMAE